MHRQAVGTPEVAWTPGAMKGTWVGEDGLPDWWLVGSIGQDEVPGVYGQGLCWKVLSTCGQSMRRRMGRMETRVS